MVRYVHILFYLCVASSTVTTGTGGGAERPGPLDTTLDTTYMDVDEG